MGPRPILLALVTMCGALIPSSAGAAPKLFADPGAVSFGAFCAGEVAPSHDVTVTNTGDATLTITSIVIEGGQSVDFSLSGAQTPRSLEPGQHMVFTVSFRPAGAGDRTAQVAIASNDPAGQTSVSLAGRGTDRRLSAQPAGLQFAPAAPGKSAKQTLRVSAAGADTVTLKEVTVRGASAKDFRASKPSRSTLSPGQQATITVTFSPGATGRRSATLAVGSDACAGALSVALSGTGAKAAIKSDPATVLMGEVSVGAAGPPTPVVVSNDGTAPLKVESLTIEGTAAADFTLEGLPSLPKTLGPGESFLINVVFRPTTGGPRAATIRVVSDDPNTPALLVGVSGNDSATATPSPSPTASSTGAGGVVHRAAAGRRGGGAGDYAAALIVMALVGGIFAGLFRVRRNRLEEM